MHTRLKTCILNGLEGRLVDIEVDMSNGLPMFNIVGLPSTSIKESKERIWSAIKNTGYRFPLKKININLSPSSIKKDGSQIDLGIALGIIQTMEIIDKDSLVDTIVLGELSLDGRVNKIIGALPMLISVRELGYKRIIIPYENISECNIFQDIEIIPVKSLKDAIDYLKKPYKIPLGKKEKEKVIEYDIDFSDIKGQEGVKRAIEIAAAGGHNLLMTGPPGSGKTMMAKRIPTILPLLTFEESIEVTKIYSISGLLKDEGIIQKRPFRSPHHTISKTALVGGGRIPKPGEISFAHNGVLFLDELPEFNRSVLEVLRQPLEEGQISISRIEGNSDFSADFILIAARNPCPCGFYGDIKRVCTCSQSQIDRYNAKISNPLLDRIDIHIQIMPVDFKDLIIDKKTEDSKSIRKRVVNARNIQAKRYKDKKIYNNSQISGELIKEYCKLNKESINILESAFKRYGLTARSYNRILKISRTMADLANRKDILLEDILESIRYRVEHMEI